MLWCVGKHRAYHQLQRPSLHCSVLVCDCSRCSWRRGGHFREAVVNEGSLQCISSIQLQLHSRHARIPLLQRFLFAYLLAVQGIRCWCVCFVSSGWCPTIIRRSRSFKVGRSKSWVLEECVQLDVGEDVVWWPETHANLFKEHFLLEVSMAE